MVLGLVLGTRHQVMCSSATNFWTHSLSITMIVTVKPECD